MTDIQREFISAKYGTVSDKNPFSMEIVKKDVFALLNEVETLRGELEWAPFTCPNCGEEFKTSIKSKGKQNMGSLP